MMICICIFWNASNWPLINAVLVCEEVVFYDCKIFPSGMVGAPEIGAFNPEQVREDFWENNTRSCVAIAQITSPIPSLA